MEQGSKQVKLDENPFEESIELLEPWQVDLDINQPLPFARNEEECLTIATQDGKESEDHSTIITQDGQEFRVPDNFLRLSETLKSLIQDASNDTVNNAIPLPSITGSVWRKIQELLPLVLAFNKPVGDDLQEEAKQNAQQEKEAIKADIIAKLKSYDGATLIDFIAAVNYLDIPILLDLAIDVAKQMNIKKVTFAQIATLPWPICKSIVLGQMARIFGPLLGKQLGICNGHTDQVHSVCVTPDGSRIVSGSEDGTIRVWNMNNLNERPVVLRGHTGTVDSVYVTPQASHKATPGTADGSKMISGSDDGTIRVWDMNNLTEPPVVLISDTNWNSVCVTPDGSRIVLGNGDGTIRVWDMNNLTEPPVMLTGHTEWVCSVCITPDGSKIVSGSFDRTVCIWNMNNLDESPVMLTGHTGSCSVCVTPDSSKIVSYGDDGTIRVWDMNNLTEPPVMLTGHTGWVCSVCVTPDGSKIISCGMGVDGTIHVWDMNNLTKPPVMLTGHTGFCSVCVTPDSSKIVSYGEDGTIRVWLLDLQIMKKEQAQCIWPLLQSDVQDDAIDTVWQRVRDILNSDILPNVLDTGVFPPAMAMPAFQDEGERDTKRQDE